MKRILVFSTNWFGDALFLFPFLAALKDNFPKTYLAVLAVPRIKDIFQDSPDVDKIIVYDQERRQGNIISRLGFIFKLRKERFDTAFIIKPSLSRTLILKCSGIRQVIGYNNPKSGWLLTTRVPLPNKTLHKIDYFLNILEYLKLRVSKHGYEFFPSIKDKNYIKELISQKGIDQNFPLVVINPGANWFPKRWLPENFAELIKRIKDKLPLNITITGADKDRDLAKQIIKQSGNQVFNFAGQTSLGQLGALMQEADIIISADSGPMHIAAAVGKRVIALFGPTSAQITGPYPLGEHIIIQNDIGCKIPCYDASCRDYRCMKAITVDEVVEKILALLTL